MENNYKYSEYQTSYYNINNKKSNSSSLNQNERPQLVKSKDTLSFGNKRLISDPAYIFHESNEASDGGIQSPANSLRSKTLNRLSNMMPENNLSWYKGDYGFYGNNNNNDETNEAINLNHTPRAPYNSLNRYKQDHIRRFDELNSGLADSYSLTKGGALLSVRNNNIASTSSSNLYLDNTPNRSLNGFKMAPPPPPPIVRPHDLRSVWIPKKFEGRNMFASHIDSTIFPDKAKNMPLFTQYNQNYDLTMESKKVFEKPTYDKIEKSVRYSVSHEGRLVPNIIWQPHLNSERYRDEPVVPLDSSQKPKTMYQIDFDSASLLKLNSINSIAGESKVKDSNSNLTDLKKRRDQIDQALLKLNS